MKETTEKQESNTYSNVREEARRDYREGCFNNPYRFGTVKYGEYQEEEAFIFSQEIQTY